MLNKKLMMLTIILVSLFAVSVVSAADNTTDNIVSVDETTEDVIGVEENQIIEQTDNDDVIGAKDAGTFKALQNKIDSAASGSTLCLENDYVFNEDTDYGRWGSGYVSIWDKDLTVDGKGHTIDAKHLTFIFNIGGTGDVTLKNINFKNAYHSGGGSVGRSASAVYFRGVGSSNDVGAFSVVGCSFVNCYNDQNGGAITFENPGYGVITDCNFLNCSAKSGAAVYCAQNVVRCSFVNSGNRVILIDSDVNSHVEDCSFLNCSGGIDICNRNGDVKNCSFQNCSGNGVGGANNVVDCSFMNVNQGIADAKNIYDCTFIGCHDDGFAGGAISSDGNVENCVFIDCSAEDGGAIYGSNSVVGCTFRDCYAECGGGAICDAYNIADCTFVNCSAAFGGAVCCKTGSNVANCNFTNNAADDGGAIFIDFYRIHDYRGNYNVNNCNFKDSANSHIAFSTDLTYYADSNLKASLTNLNFEGKGQNYGGGISFENNVLTVIGDKQYLPSDSGDIIDLSKLVYLSGDVSVNVAGKTFKTALNSGVAKIDLSSVADGTYDATISYSGCEVAPPLEVKMPLTIKSTIKIQASDVVKYCGGPEKYTVTVTNSNSKVSGANVNFKVNGKTSTAKTDSKGQATIPLDLPVGTYDIESTYNGASATSKVTVKSTLTANDVSGTYLNSKVAATFLDTAGKALANAKVSFKIGTSSYSAATNSAGVATADVPLSVGTYTVTAVNPANNEEKQFKLVISKANSRIVLSSSQRNGIATLTAELTPASATGSVAFNVNGQNTNIAVSGGKAVLTLKNLEAGNYTVTASYAGDSNLNPSKSNTVTFNVAEVHPILTAYDLTKTYGTGNGLVVNLADSRGNAIANAIVNVNIKGNAAQIRTDASGKATMQVGLAPGTYTAAASYADASDTAKILVKKANPKMTAKAKTFKKSVKTKKYTITLKNNLNKAMKNTKVTIKVNKKTYTAKTKGNGKATFKITKLNKKGKFTATITYKGDACYNKLTKKVKITVK